MQRWPVLRRIFLSFLLPLVFPGAGFLHAQAKPTASKSGGISLFASYSRVETDQDGHVNKGITFGGGYTYNLRWFLKPSIEFRAKFLPGGTVGEKTVGGGFRLEHRMKNVVPYAGFFGSYGRLTYTHPDRSGPGEPYTHDDSIVYGAGLGVDYDLTPQWSARADYQFERWKTGIFNGFVPQVFSIGVLYRIPFKPYQSR